MKSKLLTIAFLCCMATYASAQTEKGNSFIGGNVSYHSAKNESGNSKTKDQFFSVSPTYGYFFGKNFAVGLSLSYTRSSPTSSYLEAYSANGTINYFLVDNTITTNTFAGGPILRYYVDISEKFKFYGQVNGSIGHSRVKTSNANPPYGELKGENMIYSAAITPGFALFPSKKWAIELGFNLLSYVNTKPKANGVSSTYENFSFGLDSFSPIIGMNYHF